MSWRKRRGDISEEIQEHLREKTEELVAGWLMAAHRELSKRRSLRLPHAAAESGIRGGDGAHAGFGNRREYRDLQHRGERTFAPLAISACGALVCGVGGLEGRGLE
jgi:hypothetical protein